MTSPYEILEKYGNELRNGNCPKNMIDDILTQLSIDDVEVEFLIMNGTRDIDDTARFYDENKECIKNGELTSDQVNAIYRHLRIMHNDLLIGYCRVITELYFKMLKFRYVPESQTYNTMRALVDQFNVFDWNDEGDINTIYIKKVISSDMIERCYNEAKESIICIYELHSDELPEGVSNFYSIESLMDEEFDIYHYVNEYSVIGKACDVL